MLYRFAVVDGQPVTAENFNPPSDCTVLYEVIRVTDGVFLFLNDHEARLKQTAQIQGIDLPEVAADIRGQSELLTKINGVNSGNIKAEIYCRQGKIVYRAVYFIPHRYPPDETYRTGIRTTLFRAERPEPGAKVIHAALTKEIDRIIVENQVYEVIMVHPDGYITEGARSNFFTVKNDTVYTAPEADVLPSITRKYVLQICRELLLPLVEKRMPVTKLSDCNAAFISGTSPKVLPIAQTDDFLFDPDNSIVRRIMKKYDELAGLKYR